MPPYIWILTNSRALRYFPFSASVLFIFLEKFTWHNIYLQNRNKVFLQTDRNTRGGLEERGNTSGERIFTAFQEQSRVFNSLTELNTDRKFAISFGNHRSEKWISSLYFPLHNSTKCTSCVSLMSFSISLVAFYRDESGGVMNAVLRLAISYSLTILL